METRILMKTSLFYPGFIKKKIFFQISIFGFWIKAITLHREHFVWWGVKNLTKVWISDNGGFVIAVHCLLLSILLTFQVVNGRERIRILTQWKLWLLSLDVNLSVLQDFTLTEVKSCVLRSIMQLFRCCGSAYAYMDSEGRR